MKCKVQVHCSMSDILSDLSIKHVHQNHPASPSMHLILQQNAIDQQTLTLSGKAAALSPSVHLICSITFSSATLCHSFQFNMKRCSFALKRLMHLCFGGGGERGGRVFQKGFKSLSKRRLSET